MRKYAEGVEIYKQYFGRRLRMARKAADLTQADLAEKVGVEPSSVSRWETGADAPEDGRLEDICKTLKVEVSFFLPGGIPPEDELRLIELFGRMTRKGRLVALSQIESLLAFHEEKSSRAAR